MTDTTHLDRHDFAALDLIKALPDQAAKVATRANASKGVVSRKVADNLVMARKAHYAADGRITLGDPAPADDFQEYPEGEGKPAESDDPQTREAQQVEDQADYDDAVRDQEPTPAAEEPVKVNGRKAQAEKSPYSTATPTNRIKRQGKSRRTGTMTEIEDGLAKGSTFKVEGAGRYAVRCTTHNAETFVPDMTTAKPLQARTDQFCGACALALEAKAS